MKKTIISVFAFLVIFGFTVSSSIAETWTWQYAPVITPTAITELTANPATDELYGLSGGSVVPIVTDLYTTTNGVHLPVVTLSNFSDIAVGFQGAVYAITDTAVASCVGLPPACSEIIEQPIVPTDTGIFTHIAAGKDGKLFILYTEDGGNPQYILAGNPLAAIPAEVKITPQSLNLGSNGNWVSCRIGLPDSYDVKDIDPDSICITAIDGVTVPGLPICRDPGSPSSAGKTLMVKFSREVLATVLTGAGVSGSVTLTVSGTGLAGTEAFAFSGDDTIKVKAAKEKKDKKEKKPKKK